MMADLRALFILCLLYSAAIVGARGSKRHTSRRRHTLNGLRPLAIAHNGFSGLFPGASSDAYQFAIQTGLSDLLLSCQYQISIDNVGFCFPSILLDNSSDIRYLPKTQSEKSYIVNGVSLTGYFPVQFTFKELRHVNLTQGIYSRPVNFDYNAFPILTVQDLAKYKPAGLWLDVQNVLFYQGFNLSMRNHVISISKKVVINYISSTDVDFLRGILSVFSKTETKLILQIVPSNNQLNGSIIENLKYVKSFAHGILVEKTLIWPESGGYLQSHTSLVVEAHKEGLEVFASDFANDNLLAYNYSYDPIREYLQFIENGEFSVDGFFSDFPVTASAAIDCFSNSGTNGSGEAKLLVISNCGSSGDFPACTEDAYRKAVLDGTDFIDCPVQMTNDSQAMCLRSIDLVESSNAAEIFMNRVASIPEINVNDGICTFELTWNEIHQNIIPQLWSPYAKSYGMSRNPKFAKGGKFLKLSQFLDLAQKSNISGVVINVENVAYLAENRGLDVIGAVLDALGESGYANDTTKKVLIESTNSSVLKKFKEHGKFELVYKIEESVSNISNSAIEDIRTFSHSVDITKESVYPIDQSFIISATNIVQKLHSFNLSVFVNLFRNEFVSQAVDFMSDATQELNTFFLDAGVDAVVTDYPLTALMYKRNRCLKMKYLPSYMSAVEVGNMGGVLQIVTSVEGLPPAVAPLPELTDADVAERPLGPVHAVSASAPTPTSNSSHKNDTTSASPPPLTVAPLPALFASAALFLYLFR